MPPDAASKSPGLLRLASVKAPASKPNSSASSIVSGMAAQLTSTNGAAARGPLSCMTRATSPLPVPVSPWSRTVGHVRVARRVERREPTDLRAQVGDRAERRRESHRAGRLTMAITALFIDHFWPKGHKWPDGPGPRPQDH